MTEYDYSEEGYIAFKKQQEGVGRWAEKVNQYRSEFQHPSIPTPTEIGRVSEIQSSSRSSRTLSRQSGSIATASTRKAIPHHGPGLPGPAPVGEYRRPRSMSQSLPPIPLGRHSQPPPHPAYSHQRQQPVIPAPARHRTSSHSRHSSHTSRPPSRTDDSRASRSMYYANAPGNSPHAPHPKGVYTSYLVPNTRIIQLPTPRPNETYHMLPPPPGKRYEILEPSSKALRHAYNHDENQSGRRSAPPRQADARQQEAQAGLLKRMFGGIGGGNGGRDTPTRSTTPHDGSRRPPSRAQTPVPEATKRKRRKSFFW